MKQRSLRETWRVRIRQSLPGLRPHSRSRFAEDGIDRTRLQPAPGGYGCPGTFLTRFSPSKPGASIAYLQARLLPPRREANYTSLIGDFPIALTHSVVHVLSRHQPGPKKLKKGRLGLSPSATTIELTNLVGKIRCNMKQSGRSPGIDSQNHRQDLGFVLGAGWITFTAADSGDGSQLLWSLTIPHHD